MKNKIINKNNTINKIYCRKLWDFVVKTDIDVMNGDIDEQEFLNRCKKFEKMLNDIIKNKKG